MKKLLINCIAVLVFSSTSGQTLLDKHEGSSVYQFNHVLLYFSNQFIKDEGVKFSPQYFQYPFNNRNIAIYGPVTQLAIIKTDEKDPAHTKPIFFAVLSDTAIRDKDLFLAKSLEVSVNLNGKILSNWKDITKLTPGKINHSYFKNQSATILFNDSLKVNDVIDLVFRSKTLQKELIRFHIQRMERPVIPYLASWWHDTSAAKNSISFIEKILQRKNYELNSTDGFYENWPSDYSGHLNNEKYYESSKLALNFRRYSKDYPDSSMEYRLINESTKDTGWHKTGHQLLVTDLQADKHYVLSIRYISHPENVQQHRFYVMPRWYQTKKYKLIAAGISIVIFLLILLVTYRVRIRKIQQKNANLQLEMKSIRSQLNPHFIFNALSSIQGLINKNDISAANHYLTEFSSLLRETLVNNDKELVPLSTELRIIETYLKLEQLRFHFQYELIVDASVNKDAVEIPSLLIQPLVENAIKHGVALLHHKGIVQIGFQTKDKTLLVSINDNGKGFSEDAERKGFGLTLTKDRIRLLNKTLKGQPIELHIENSPENGTSVHLNFQNWL